MQSYLPLFNSPRHFSNEFQGEVNDINYIYIVELGITWTIDNEGEIYLDGKQVTVHDDDSSRVWSQPTRTAVPIDSKVVGFVARNQHSVSGLVASYDNQWSTADTRYWRCTSTQQSNTAWSTKRKFINAHYSYTALSLLTL